jgi:hypothetical protein
VGKSSTILRGKSSQQCERCEISSSHGGEYEAKNLLGCTAVFLNDCHPMFQRYVLPPSSLITMMMEAARTSETSVDIQLRTRQYIPEDSGLNVKDHHYFYQRIGCAVPCSNDGIG